MGRVRVPRLKALKRPGKHRAQGTPSTQQQRDAARKPGKHTAARVTPAPRPEYVGRRRLDQAPVIGRPPYRPTPKKPEQDHPGARAQLEARADVRSPRRYGARETPRDDQTDRLGGRNYPPKPGRHRAKNPTADTRAQLAARGGPANPHPRSGDMARSNVKAAGRAKRQAAPLPGDSAPVEKRRRQPATSGHAFFGR